eukprot:CAMPEP_0198242920 /NCGR_PEP_ID=MMETSP1446-20131203/22642_1 /TAXON_ID=1461542 ORGANISM="Unidentified sp, Strain CCMP2111" /NCGR_SAMPLE_ID=MMETSP1446 /ASSEMBLY_ACC=CAM_ASM_001112 /LENGTH=652 /DNA_ID=CAMNT_0043926593 /DNA_START=91 /DNA_END=2049 /DNA_ORIENTATION=-
MAAARKLQSEIEKTLKKVQEGVEIFDELWEKLHECEYQNQKEKFEAELKKEIKRLQRYRDQIKTWIQSTDVKDKKLLIDARKAVEREMERFKICERETKTKAYSKEGLTQAQKMDPKDKARQELRDWLNSSVDKLNNQIDELESELEMATSSKKKNRVPDSRVSQVEVIIARDNDHIKKLEYLLRLLDNEQLDPEDVEDLQEFLDDYIERNQDSPEEFEEVDYFYEGVADKFDLNLASIPFTKEKEDKHSSEDKEASHHNESHAKEEAHSSSHATHSAADSSKESHKQTESKSGSSAKVATPTKASRPADQQRMADQESGGAAPRVDRVRSSSGAIPAKQAAAPPSGPPLGWNYGFPQGGDHPSDVDAVAQGSRQLKDIAMAADRRQPGMGAFGASVQDAGGHYGLGAQVQASGPGLVSNPSLMGSSSAAHRGQAGREQVAAADQGQAAFGVSLHQQGADPSAGVGGFPSHPGSSRYPVPDDGSRMQQGPEGVPSSLVQKTAPSDGTPSHPRSALNHLHSVHSIPQEQDRKWNTKALSRKVANAPMSYPRIQPPALQDPSIYERFDGETLFFAFYYQPGTYNQFLAARALKKKNWRFNKKHNAWFQRLKEPAHVTPEHEQGSYVWFDYGPGWRPRVKENFVFEYSDLENEVR